LGNETGSHHLVGELSSFEVGTSGTGGAGVLHVSTLEGRATEMLSQSTGKRFSVDNSSGGTIKLSRGDVTGEGSTAASKPVAVQALRETKGMDDLVHDADHLLFVEKDIGSGLHVVSTDDSLTDKGSLGARGQGARDGTGDVAAGRVELNHEEPISVNTRSQD